jgi:alkylhydroperoxidase family enzyme
VARLRYLDRKELAPEDQDILARDINLHRALAHSPDAARAFGGLGQFIRHKSRLDPRLREMAILQVGWLARSPYEWSHHIKIGKDFGVSDEDIRALIDDTDGRPTSLDELTRLVLRGAREMAVGPAMEDATFAALRSHLDEERLLDLVVTIGFYACVVRVLATLQIDVEDSYMPYLEQFPLPK